MPKRTNISSILVIGAALALPARAFGAERREVRPPRFQVEGWVTNCWPGEAGMAADCEATKEVGDYRLRMSVGDEQFFQFIAHPRCQEQMNTIFRDALFGGSAEDRRRWTVKVFKRLARDMAKKCPKLPPLDNTAFRTPPDLNMASEDDIH